MKQKDDANAALEVVSGGLITPVERRVAQGAGTHAEACPRRDPEAYPPRNLHLFTAQVPNVRGGRRPMSAKAPVVLPRASNRPGGLVADAWREE